MHALESLAVRQGIKEIGAILSANPIRTDGVSNEYICSIEGSGQVRS